VAIGTDVRVAVLLIGIVVVEVAGDRTDVGARVAVGPAISGMGVMVGMALFGMGVIVGIVWSGMGVIGGMPPGIDMGQVFWGAPKQNDIDADGGMAAPPTLCGLTATRPQCQRVGLWPFAFCQLAK